MAHYHMGGIRVTPAMQTRVPRLFAAGEAVGGANGANRLSGNAITEAFVFGRVAGLAAAECARGDTSQAWREAAAEAASGLVAAKGRGRTGGNPAGLIARLQKLMAGESVRITLRKKRDG